MLKFYCSNKLSRRFNVPGLSTNMSVPCVVLTHDNWDDWGYGTLYRVAIYNDKRTLVYESWIKILDENSKDTELDAEFYTLSDQYCSLWQTPKDYEELSSMEYGAVIMEALNDLNHRPEIRKKFRYNQGLTDSLLRFSDAAIAFHEGRDILNKKEIKRSFSFTYEESDKSPTPFGEIKFEFSRKLQGLYRIIGIIGRNGVGKTTLLANLAVGLSGISRGHTKLTPRPPFRKIIAVSYSTFDDFYRPTKKERTFSYFYCGIRGDDDLLSKEEIHALFESSFKKINDAERLDNWIECMNVLFLDKLDIYFPNKNDVMASFQELSSGQKIMTLSFTQIIAEIETNSLLLFDEPETHLHPNGQNTIFKCLDLLLGQFDSFAILSTHSTIFIQNIPKANVKKMSLVDKVRVMQPLGVESFGQHFSTLTEDVFGFSEKNLYYIEKLKSIHADRKNLGKEYEEIQSITSIGARYNLKKIENG